MATTPTPSPAPSSTPKSSVSPRSSSPPPSPQAPAPAAAAVSAAALASAPLAPAPPAIRIGKDLTSPFRRIQQTERLDDTFACTAMVVRKPLTEVAEAAYRLGYPKHGPAIASETLIAKLIMELGQLVASKYLDFHTWEALPDVAIVYVDYDQDMEIGRHILRHHVRASGKQNALSSIIDPAHWIKPEQRITTDLKRYKPDRYIEIRPTGKR